MNSWAYPGLLLTAFLASLPFYPVQHGLEDYGTRKPANNWLLAGFFFAIVVLMFGLRYGVGTDYFGYLDVFERVKSQNVLFLQNIEPGFILLNTLIAEMGFSGQAVLFFCFAISFGALYALLPNHGLERLLALVLLLTTGPVFSMTNIVRQYLAIALCSYSFVVTYNRPRRIRLIVVLLTIVVSALFHYSALVCVFFFLVPERRIHPLLWITIAVIAVGIARYAQAILVFVFSIFPFISGNYERYLFSTQMESGVTGLGLRLYFEVFLMVLFSLYAHRIDSEHRRYFNIAYLGTVLRLALSGVALFSRLSSYFIVFQFISLPSFLGAARKKESKMLFTAAVIIYSLFLFGRILTSPQWNPYRSVLGR